MINKNALQAEKDKLKQELKYYNKRLQDLQKEIRSKQVYECESSDSENETFTLAKIGPSISQLKSEEYSQQTCLQATQELTSVVVLEAEVKCLTEPPEYARGTTIKEGGTWREVTAECRIDLVPFSINFYTHKANRMFAPTLYRELKVLPVKNAQDIELRKSVLSHVDKPSDAVEVLKSYATAHRARRTTLARLAIKYNSDLHMEPMADGGFSLKCGSVLDLSWRLENRRSSLSPFHHKMSFNLDYMDESHLKIIRQAHKKLSGSSIDVNERTQLLSTIISTCLEIKQLHEGSIESDAESKKLEKTVLEDISEENSGEHGENLEENNEVLGENVEKEVENCEKTSNKHKKRDMASKNLPKNLESATKNTENRPKNNETASKNNKKGPANVEKLPANAENEIMAPPKSFPKKTKPKTKENTTDNRKSVKRSAEGDQNGTKKAKITENPEQNVPNAQKEANNDTTNEENDPNAQKGAKNDKTKEKNIPNAQKGAKNDKTNKKNVPNAQIEAKNDKPNEKNDPNSQKEAKNDKSNGKHVPKAQKDPKKVKTNEKVGQSAHEKVEDVVSDKNDIDYTTFVATLIGQNNSESSKNKEQHHVRNNAKKAKLNENQVQNTEISNTNSKNSKTNQKVPENQNNDPKNDQNKQKNNQNTNQVEKNKKTENNPTKSQNTKPKTIEKTSTEKQSSKNNVPKSKIVENNKENTDIYINQEKDKQNNEKETENPEKNTAKTFKNKPVIKNALKSTDKAKKPLTNSDKTIKIPKKVASDKNSNATKKVTDTFPSNYNKKNLQNNEKSNKNVPKNSEISKKIQKIFENKNTVNKQPKNITNSNEITNKKPTTDPKSTKHVNNAKKMVDRSKLLIKSHKNQPKVKKTGNTETVKDGKISKIPQKKFGSNSDTNLKNVLRMSPRLFPSKFKSPSDSNLLGKMAKVHTNIPMLKKPSPKV